MRVAPALRQEIKRSARAIVQKELLHISVLEFRSDGKQLPPEELNHRQIAATLERVEWLKQGYRFHHGDLKLPEPEQADMVCRRPRALPSSN